MATYQDGWKRPKKKSLDYICLILFSYRCIYIFTKLYKSQLKKTILFLLLTVNIFCQGLASALNSIIPLVGFLQILQSSLQDAYRQVSLLFKKQENELPLYCSLSFGVTRCTTRFHLYFVVVILMLSVFLQMIILIGSYQEFKKQTQYRMSLGKSFDVE